MSSVQSAFSQVAPREKFLVATGAAVNRVVVSGETVTSSMSSTAWSGANGATAAGAAITAGDLFRDMGKTVTVYDPDTLLAVEKYQKVFLVAGPGSEGVPTGTLPADRYVRVWDAAGSDPELARVG